MIGIQAVVGIPILYMIGYKPYYNAAGNNMKKAIVLLLFLLTGCSIRGSDYDQGQEKRGGHDFYPISECHKLPSDSSVFITFKVPPFLGVTFLVGDNFFRAQPSISLSTPFVEVGLQDEFPIERTSPDFLYLVIKDYHWPIDKRQKIYCLDLNNKSIEIIPGQVDISPLRILVSQNELKAYQGDYETIQYKTLEGRHILGIDVSDKHIQSIQIKPLDPLPIRLIKPEPIFKYCREVWNEHKISFLLVCPSDGLEFLLGLFPRLIGRFHPVLGWISLILGEGGIFVFLLIKVFEQKNIWGSLLLLVFTSWFVLVIFNVWPYALLYP